MTVAVCSAEAEKIVARVLIVEDEALVAMEEEDILTRAGFEVVGTADDYASALALADTHAPNLALVDIRLGATSGMDVAAEFTKRGIRCIFVTGNCPHERGAAVGIGCLHKPFTPRNLTEAVRIGECVLNDRRPTGRPCRSSFHLYETA